MKSKTSSTNIENGIYEPTITEKLMKKHYEAAPKVEEFIKYILGKSSTSKTANIKHLGLEK